MMRMTTSRAMTVLVLPPHDPVPIHDAPFLPFGPQIHVLPHERGPLPHERGLICKNCGRIDCSLDARIRNPSTSLEDRLATSSMTTQEKSDYFHHLSTVEWAKARARWLREHGDENLICPVCIRINSPCDARVRDSYDRRTMSFEERLATKDMAEAERTDYYRHLSTTEWAKARAGELRGESRPARLAREEAEERETEDRLRCIKRRSYGMF